MEPNNLSTLHHVVVNFAKRTIELYGEDGEYKEVTCDFTSRGHEQFENLVKLCQEKLPIEMREYKYD